MYSFKIGLLPSVFKEVFLMINQVHSYNIRNSNAFYLFPAPKKYKTFWYKISGSPVIRNSCKRLKTCH